MESKLSERMKAYSDLGGYEAFRDDLKRLEIANSMCGLCQIRAEVWLEKLNQLGEEELEAYIRKYRPGLLDPFAGY
ncbi:hypothetical protein [Flintibacter porci]|uniref:hypothetical protein n=1 Tax=Flintibacter porci TaxID=3342383 RepID=UPI003F8B4F95